MRTSTLLSQLRSAPAAFPCTRHGLAYDALSQRARGEMADALVSGTSGEIHGGSSPLERTLIHVGNPADFSGLIHVRRALGRTAVPRRKKLNFARRRAKGRSIQHLAHFADARVSLPWVRLGQELDSRLQHSMMRDGIVRITRREEHFKIGIGCFQPFGHYFPAHLRHNDVGDHQTNRQSFMLMGHAQGFPTVRRRPHVVTLTFQ